MLRTLNLDGDRQADLSVHGGPTKAVYAYPSEHYEFWRNEFPEMTLPWGMFGENFTVEGMDESSINIGDKFRIGEAEVMVTEPRMPCYKLGIKFGRSDIIKKFLVSGRSGFYFSVFKEGQVGADDQIEMISRDELRRHSCGYRETVLARQDEHRSHATCFGSRGVAGELERLFPKAD